MVNENIIYLMIPQKEDKKETKKETKKELKPDELQDLISRMGGDILGSGVQVSMPSSLDELKKQAKG